MMKKPIDISWREEVYPAIVLTCDGKQQFEIV